MHIITKIRNWKTGGIELEKIFLPVRNIDTSNQPAEVQKAKEDTEPKTNASLIANLYLEIDYLRKKGDYEGVIKTYKKIISLNPKSDYAYARLGWFLFCYAKRKTEAVENLQKAIDINPSNSEAWWGLGEANDNNAVGAEMYKKVIEIEPYNAGAYGKLGMVYTKLGRYKDASGAFRKNIELAPEDERAYGGLAIVYKKLGLDKEAETYFIRSNELRLKSYNVMTRQNYQRIKEILDKRSTVLVAVQYPMRNVNSLKNIFKDQKNIVFVDNEMVFKKAVRKNGYDDYFIDNFGGDFGHCTPKGNRLLAENVAKVILREVFNR